MCVCVSACVCYLAINTWWQNNSEMFLKLLNSKKFRVCELRDSIWIWVIVLRRGADRSLLLGGAQRPMSRSADGGGVHPAAVLRYDWSSVGKSVRGMSPPASAVPAWFRPQQNRKQVCR